MVGHFKYQQTRWVTTQFRQAWLDLLAACFEGLLLKVSYRCVTLQELWFVLGAEANALVNWFASCFSLLVLSHSSLPLCLCLMRRSHPQFEGTSNFPCGHSRGMFSWKRNQQWEQSWSRAQNEKQSINVHSGHGVIFHWLPCSNRHGNLW